MLHPAKLVLGNGLRSLDFFQCLGQQLCVVATQTHVLIRMKFLFLFLFFIHIYDIIVEP